MPAVSICLPVFNGEKYLTKALESALAQTYDDFELLISDDCSKDGSADIIQHFARQDKRIIAWRNETNLGLFANYNACVEKAKGRYIKLFAQDDIFHSELIQRQVAVLQKNPLVSLVASARRPIDADGNAIASESVLETKCVSPFSQDTKLIASDAISSVLRDGINWLGEPSSQMYRAEFRGAGFDTSFKQLGDLEYAFRILQSGDYFYIADALCCFRKHAGSSSATTGWEMSAHLEWITLAAKYKEYLSQVDLTPEEYCLNFVKAWTRDLECELNKTERLEQRSRIGVLRDLYGRDDILASFMRDKDQVQDALEQFRMLGAMALLQSAILEHELRVVHDEIAKPYGEPDSVELQNLFVRPGLVSALHGLKETLRERDKEIIALRAKLDEIGRSFSWRITEPIRALNQRAGKGEGGPN